jgi:hypothetical protein
MVEWECSHKQMLKSIAWVLRIETSLAALSPKPGCPQAALKLARNASRCSHNARTPRTIAIFLKILNFSWRY